MGWRRPAAGAGRHSRHAEGWRSGYYYGQSGPRSGRPSDAHGYTEAHDRWIRMGRKGRRNRRIGIKAGGCSASAHGAAVIGRRYSSFFLSSINDTLTIFLSLIHISEPTRLLSIS